MHSIICKQVFADRRCLYMYLLMHSQVNMLNNTYDTKSQHVVFENIYISSNILNSYSLRMYMFDYMTYIQCITVLYTSSIGVFK